jgi:hypothetical protein
LLKEPNAPYGYKFGLRASTPASYHHQSRRQGRRVEELVYKGINPTPPCIIVVLMSIVVK